MGKAVKSGIVKFDIVDIRDYSQDKFNRCDDYPYGGGSGMVLSPSPLFKAIEENEANENENSFILYASPSGTPLSQDYVKYLSGLNEISIICGHYEGIDQRVIDKYVSKEISIGDYILSGGEYAALVITDAVARYIPDFMSNRDSLLEESFISDLLEYPQYTRPVEFKGMNVPQVLLSGDHKEIAKWRHEKRIEKTKIVRPDLFKKYITRIIQEE
jgi:tRNA (guanine37-N1)-methyltransferase